MKTGRPGTRPVRPPSPAAAPRETRTAGRAPPARRRAAPGRHRGRPTRASGRPAVAGDGAPRRCVRADRPRSPRPGRPRSPRATRPCDGTRWTPVTPAPPAPAGRERSFGSSSKECSSGRRTYHGRPAPRPWHHRAVKTTARPRKPAKITGQKKIPPSKAVPKAARPAAPKAVLKKAVLKKALSKTPRPGPGRRADLGAPIDAFFAKRSGPLRQVLDRLRAMVDAEVPDAASSIKWGMPFYTLGGKPVCALAV